jgi:MFS family permease
MQDPASAVDDNEPSRAIRTVPLSPNVRLLGLASLVNDIAGEMIFPLVPTFLLTQVGGSTASLGAVEGVADTVASIVKLWSGGLSDRVGKRKIFVVAGYAMAAVARPLVALAGAPWHVLAVRSADRFGKGIRSAPRDAMIADSSEPALRGRAFGFTRAMDHLGAAIGPFLAFSFLWMWPNSLRALFALTAIPGLAVVLAVWFGLREKPLLTHAAKELPSTLAPFDRNFRVYLLALVLFTLGNSSDSFLLVRVRELGIATELLPLVWCAFHIVKSAGSIAAGRAVDRFGARPLIVAGWVIYALIYLAFAQASAAWEGWVFFMVYALFHALTEPAERTFVLNLVGEDRKGLAYGWFNLAIGIAALPANLAFGLIYEWYGGPIAFRWSAALAAVAVGALWFVRAPAAMNPAR